VASRSPTTKILKGSLEAVSPDAEVESISTSLALPLPLTSLALIVPACLPNRVSPSSLLCLKSTLTASLISCSTLGPRSFIRDRSVKECKGRSPEK
jgi:hypothetical protein